MRHYCCYFDHRYASRGLAMIRSLRRFDAESPMWILALTKECEQLLESVAERNIHVVSLAQLEEAQSGLREAKGNRSLIEYYFTLTPSWLCYVMDRSAAGDVVTYVDGDLFFFADPEPLHRELDRGHVAITGHRFPPFLKRLERYGKYNVGWVSFRNSEAGRAVVEWWRDRCNEWCYDAVEEDRFADQKYLERFATISEGVVVLEHDGANVAPWNLALYDVTLSHGRLEVRPDVPLIFFHFHGLKPLARWLYVSGHTQYRAPFRGTVRREIYQPYVTTIAAIEDEIREHNIATGGSLGRSVSSLKSWPHRMLSALLRVTRDCIGILRGEAILVISGRSV